MRVDIPTVYIGETCRSIFERSKEHWEGAVKCSEKNHMGQHQKLEHNGEPHPHFHMKVTGFFKTALARQVAEAVHIRRRGGEGSILNLRGSFQDVTSPGSKWCLRSRRTLMKGGRSQPSSLGSMIKLGKREELGS